jgi:exodeoxyribonuclease V gamma subunit
MKNIYFSLSTESLAKELAARIKSGNGSLFTKTLIITQTTGMDAWLTTRLTEENGIFAHFDFVNPGGFIAKVHELLTGDKLSSSRDASKYALYALLESDGFKAKFADVAAYYTGNELRRMQLADRIADLFDQYQLYRPEWIDRWNGNQRNTADDAEIWQMWLWEKLKIESRKSMIDIVFAELEKDDKKEILKKTYPAIHLFGISIMPDMQRDFYLKLWEYTDVSFYLCLPTNSPMPYQHELLESMGKKSGELYNGFAETQSTWLPYEFSDSTILNRLQKSIAANKNPDVSIKGSIDDSIQVTSHFTPVREIETLYNYLLDLFEKETVKPNGLKSHEILVITPDINKYEPLIKAVFRNAPVKIPFTVTGAGAGAGNTITAALEQLLTLREDEMNSENVIGLLEQTRIRKTFRVEDCGYVRNVVQKANIRFGLENSLENDTHFVSWKFGLEKFILGYAMLTDEEFDVSYRLTEQERAQVPALTTYPYADAEASRSHDLLRLKVFIDTLSRLFEEQKNPRSLQQWKTFFVEFVLPMVYCNGSDKNDRKERNDIFKALNFADSDELKSTQVTWEVFLYELRTRLFNKPVDQKTFSGGITFTSTIPARGLPFRVIAFIGLDNGVFPRRDHFPGFDLMGETYLPGDRSSKEADKSMFLDTIMAAREKLYLSYIGQDVKTNTSIPPSIVLDTLMNYLSTYEPVAIEKAREGQEHFMVVPVVHPLHGFSRKYSDKTTQNGENKLFTYFCNSQNGGKNPSADTETNPQKQEETPADLTTDIQVSVADFVKFFESPIDSYFIKVLGIYYDEADDTLAETELFELNKLQLWCAKNEYMQFNGEASAFISKGIKQGNLPLKNLGRYWGERCIGEAQPLKEVLAARAQGKEPSSEYVELSFGAENQTIVLKGNISGVYGRDYIVCTLSTSDHQEKYRVRSYLNALILYACGHIDDAMEFSMNKDNEVVSYRRPFIPKEEAKKQLALLMHYYLKGMENPLKFTLKSANEELIDNALNKICSEANGNPFASMPGNKYVKALWDSGYFEDFTQEDLDEMHALKTILNY